MIRLSYGREGRFTCEVDAERVLAAPTAPPPNPHFVEDLREALRRPLEFPPLEQAVIPDDRVTLAVDRHTPGAADLVAAVWDVLAQRGVRAENVTVIQPSALDDAPLADPRSSLPEPVRRQMGWTIHNPQRKGECTFLGATASGERISLSRTVVDADVALSIGEMAYDSLLGYRGTNSVFYPGLSSPEAISRAHGQGHRELGPEDIRPLRQMVDEVGWLLGTQFAVQVVPSAGDGVADVLAGAGDAVFRKGRELLAERWLVELDERPEIVVAAVDADSRGHGWRQIGAALETARNLVAHGGKIVVLSEVSTEPGRGMQRLRECESPRDAIRPLREEAPPDLIAATQLANAADWADVYLLSGLPAEVVEEFFLIPLDEEREVRRLLEGGGSCAFLDAAQKRYGRVRG